jgi:hypothetical protein
MLYFFFYVSYIALARPIARRYRLRINLRSGGYHDQNFMNDGLSRHNYAAKAMI